MAAPFGTETSLSPEVKERAERLLEAQGYRELAIAHLFALAVCQAPTLATKQLLAERTAEELEHFEVLASIFEEIGRGDLLEKVRSRVALLPLATTWIESAVAHLLVDRVGKFHLREGAASAFAPYAESIRRILADEELHDAMSAANVREVCGKDPANIVVAQAAVLRWLRVSLQSFGDDLLRTDAVREYVVDLAPALAACGLKLPTRAALELDLPEGVLEP